MSNSCIITANSLFMKKTFILVLLAGILFQSCTEKIIVESDTQKIDGYWTNMQVSDTLFVMQRASELTDNEYCFAFLEDSKFIEQKNSGWCGTPPVMYARYEGTWSLQDSIIQISVPYWGGMVHYTWKLVNCNEESLEYFLLSADYEETIAP